MAWLYVKYDTAMFLLSLSSLIPAVVFNLHVHILVFREPTGRFLSIITMLLDRSVFEKINKKLKNWTNSADTNNLNYHMT